MEFSRRDYFDGFLFLRREIEGYFATRAHWCIEMGRWRCWENIWRDKI
jgi:hypothetical protein